MEQPTSTNYPYSESLQRLLDLGSKVKIYPVFAIGMNRADLHTLRNAYLNPESGLKVGIYGIYDSSVLQERIGLAPTVVVLAEHVRISDGLAGYIKKFRVPVLRLMRAPVALQSLCHEDYYGGVYEVMATSDIGNTECVTYMLNLGIFMWLHTHGSKLETQQTTDRLISLNFDVLSETNTSSMRATWSMRKSVHMPKPEISWEVFATKQLTNHASTERYIKRTSMDADSHADSSFDLNLDS